MSQDYAWCSQTWVQPSFSDIYGEMLAMLKELEWKAGETEFCQCCFQVRPDGHDDDCELAALLAKAEGRATIPPERSLPPSTP